MILQKLGIYGWKEADENLVLASLLTGDPMILIGPHGAAKSCAVHKIAQALGRTFQIYDASKIGFDDLLGFPDIHLLQKGKVEYVGSPVTIWDKALIVIDEINRAVPELQSKWLEIIRSRTISGFPTETKWVFSCMNPISYSATNQLDDALIGRFALFLYPPDVIAMDEKDRIAVAKHLNGEDSPALSEWTGGVTGGTVPKADVEAVGEQLHQMLTLAGQRFLRLRDEMATLPEFLARFAALLVKETGGDATIDGRRLGFIHRNIIANRAIEISKAEVLGTDIPDFVGSATYVVQSSIPVGLNDEGLNREELVHKMEICFDLLSSYFESGAEIMQVNLIYELLTTKDLMRKAELLLTKDLNEMALSKAWTDLMKGDDEITLLAYTALQVEVRRPGTIPQELLMSLSGKVEPEKLSTQCIERLEDDAVEHVDAVETLLDQPTDLAKLVAYHHVGQLTENGHVNPSSIAETATLITRDISAFTTLLEQPQEKGD